jgi:drug/metabolite transporter (DMT)-like permease
MKAALIKLHIAVFLWGFTGVLGRTIQLNEGLLVWYRLLITLAGIVVWGKATGTLTLLPFKKMLQLAGIGSIIMLHWICFYGSIKCSNVSIALTCLSSAGLITALLEPLFTRQPWNWKEVALGGMGIAGIYLIFHFDSSYRMGIAIGLLASLLTCVFSLFNKKLIGTVATQNLMLYELGGGFLLLTALMPLYLHYFPARYVLPTGADWFWLTILSLGCTVLAMALSLQALKKVSVFTQNLTLNLEPVYGIILAFVVYKEHQYLDGSFYVGFGLIVLSVVLQMKKVAA